MYSPIAYAIAQGLIEIPYVAVQTIVFGVITYFLVNFDRDVGKFFLYLLFLFLTFTYFTFYGMMCVGVTPTPHFVAIISSAFYSMESCIRFPYSKISHSSMVALVRLSLPSCLDTSRYHHISAW